MLTVADMLETALEWHAAGYSVIPIKGDGSKRPALDAWQSYMDTQPSVDEVTDWGRTHTGMGVVCGGPMRLEMLEVEGYALHTSATVRQLMADNGLADPWGRIMGGYLERSPRGGFHWFFRVADGPARGNTKLARRRDPDDPTKVQVMWETRGQGGQTIIAPSAGGAWAVVRGTVADIPTITADERDQVYAVLAMLDEMPTAEPAPVEHTRPRGDDDGLRPGDDYNNRASWDEILVGWTRAKKMGAGWTWRRPGKTDPGISATTGQAADGVDRLFVFSTSTEFEAERPYSKFAAYALLNHGGDMAGAAAALRRAGYGAPPADVDQWVASLPTEEAPTPAPDAADGAPDAPERPTLADELANNRLLAEMVADMLRRERAKEIILEIRERANPKPAPDCGTVADLLARPETDQWRIEGLLPAGGRMLFTAQRKTGKTTAVGNLSRSLIDGVPFLGDYHATPVTGRIAVLNYEVTGATFARWMDDVGIRGDRMYVENLRGCVNPLTTEQGREELVARLIAQGAEILVVDPFGRAYHGKDQNDAAQITPWLVTLDQVAEMAQCSELILTAHAGWNGERTRGSSALEDWPDVIVTMTKDEHGQRYIRAEGRDVDIDEGEIEYNDQTRTYRATGNGGKAEAQDRRQVERLVDALVDTVNRNPGKGVNALFKMMKEAGITYTNGIESRVSREAESRGLVEVKLGPNRARQHYPTFPDSGGSGGSEVGPRSYSSALITSKGTERAPEGLPETESPNAPRCVVCHKPNPTRYPNGLPQCPDCRNAAGA